MSYSYPKSIVHTEASHGWGGQELRILSESKWFISMGVRVTILADRKSKIYEEAITDGVPVLPVRLARKSLLDLWSVSRALRFLAPEVVVAHSSTDHWIVALCRALFNLSFRIVRVRHVSAVVKRNIATIWLYNHGADLIVTTSSEIKKALTVDGFIPENKAVSIPTGIDLRLFDPFNDYDNIREHLGIPRGDRVIGSVATLRSWKGHADLIGAFELLGDKNIHLLIVGDGPARGSLELLKKNSPFCEKIHLVGHVSDVRPFLKALDVFVFPSYANEGVPQAILQAMSFNLRIICSSLAGIREALHDYQKVRLFAPRDIYGITKEIRNSLDLIKTDVSTPSKFSSDLDRISIDRMGESMRRVYTKQRMPTLSIYCRGNNDTPSTKARILQFKEVFESQFFVRTSLSCQNINPLEFIWRSDTIYLQKIVPRLRFWILRALLPRSKFYFDYDDKIWEPVHNSWSALVNARVKSRLFFVQKFADKVTVTSNELSKSFSKSRVTQVPIATSDPFRNQPSPTPVTLGTRQIVIGWAGHPQSHFQIEAIYPILEYAKVADPNLKIVFLTGIPPKRASFYDWLPYTAELEREFFSNVDIGIVPIENTSFSRGKSPIKIIQHFAFGRTIMTNGCGATLEICNDTNSFILPSFSELQNVIRSCRDHPEIYLSKCRNARQTFLDNHESGAVAGRLIRAISSD